MDGMPQHIDFWAGAQQELLSAGIDAAWFYPTYSLTPHASYPTQLNQAIEALRYVLEDLGREPQDIILAGDSAGGNLCLAILSHLMHPAEGLPKLEVRSPLKRMILISPWLSFKTSWGSMTRNVHKDIDSIETLRQWAIDYLGGRASDNYVEAILAAPEWWSNAPVERTLVVAGADEVFLDPITVWTDKFQVRVAVL